MTAEVKKIEINYPSEINKTAVTEVDGLIIFVRYEHDDNPFHPLDDCDGMGKIHSFCRRHSNFVDPDTVDWSSKEDFVLLSYFEHGQCLWGVNGSMEGMPDFRWDGVSVAGYWEPDDALLQEARIFKGIVRRAKMVKWAKQACEVYTQWCNGYVYWFNVTVHWARYAEDSSLFDEESDYRFEDPITEDSCGGYYGNDEEYMKECILDNIKYAFKKEKPDVPGDAIKWA